MSFLKPRQSTAICRYPGIKIIGALLVLTVIIVSCVILFSDTDGSETVTACPTLQIYPSEGSPCCLLVNQSQENIYVSKRCLIEQESNGIWNVCENELVQLEDCFTLSCSRVLIYSLAAEMGSYNNQEGHYRATFYDGDNDPLCSCEFRVSDSWDLDQLALTDILSPSPFATDLTSTNDMDIQIAIDPDYTVTGQEAFGFSYTIGNRTAETIQCGQEHYVEVLIDNTYYLTPIAGWDAVSYDIEAESYFEMPSLAYLIGTMGPFPPYDNVFSWPTGDYRLIIPIAIRHADGTQTNQLISQAFSVT